MDEQLDLNFTDELTAARRDKHEKRRTKKTRGHPFQDESEEEKSEDEIFDQEIESPMKRTLSNKRGSFAFL